MPAVLQHESERDCERGSTDLRRLYVGRYRVLYAVTDTSVTVVVHIGRTG
ncbi:type II toxin-antitoxin system RelE/ParE family toxin [Streptomyces sp. NBC_00467]